MERAEIIERMKAGRIAKAGRNAARRAFAVKLWNDLVNDQINGSLGPFMATAIRKLQRVKFGIDGSMLMMKTRKGERGMMDRAYEYAARHYPTILKIWESAMDEFDKKGE